MSVTGEKPLIKRLTALLHLEEKRADLQRQLDSLNSRIATLGGQLFSEAPAEKIEEALGEFPAQNGKSLEKVVADLRRQAGDSTRGPRVVQVTDEDVPAALEAVFDKHREVLRRLAE